MTENPGTVVRFGYGRGHGCRVHLDIDAGMSFGGRSKVLTAAGKTMECLYMFQAGGDVTRVV